MPYTPKEKKTFKHRVIKDVIDVLKEEHNIDVSYTIKWDDNVPNGKSPIPNIEILKNYVRDTELEPVLNDLLSKLANHQL